MPKLTTKQLVDVVQRSRLVETADLKDALRQFKADHGGSFPSDSHRLGEFLVSQGILSRWQYDRLKVGKYKGFFLGKYRLLDHLGTGGMGTVYLADHKAMHRQVAIKVLPPNRVDDTSYLERFYLEAQAVAALDHPNIVRAYDVDREGDIHYLVMEYVRGSDLTTVVRQSEKPIHFALIADYVAQAARGLQHAHDAGLIHRDVKPANLLVDLNGTVKLLDLGLALMAGDGSSVSFAHQENILGTADYLAPEQAVDSHNIDARADIYSLGCTLYFTITGQPPFNEGTLAQRVLAHQSQVPRGVREIRPDTPDELAQLCQRMMEKSPEDRVQTAREVAEQLDRWRIDAKAHLPLQDSSPIVIHTDADEHNAPPRQHNEGFQDVANLHLVGAPIDAPLSQRKRRKSSAKKPPLTLWIVLAVLSIVAISMSVYLFTK